VSADEPLQIVVLAGGISTEREVSLGSGRAAAAALARHHPTRLIEVNSAAFPAGLVTDRDIVFSTLHGTFGEDGGMQALLEEAGVVYAGCDAASSALTFDKELTKNRAAEIGLRVPGGHAFNAKAAPSSGELIGKLGEAVVLKPQRGGSSVGLAMCRQQAEIEAALGMLDQGDWLAEQWITGREVTVGVVGDRALPVVEIVPKAGVFDYAAKYTKGQTEYLAPAPLPPEVAAALQADALQLFRACGCRDYARIDFMITSDFGRFLLEINTLPGMKETSLLPMGARCAGIDFTALVGELISPAKKRRQQLLKSKGAA
jgi:D-alanine-D-alanine ligase